MLRPIAPARLTTTPPAPRRSVAPWVDALLLICVLIVLNLRLVEATDHPTELPVASGLILLPAPDDPEIPEVKTIVVHVDAAGTLRVGGRTCDLASEDPGILDDAVQTLRMRLRRVHAEGGGRVTRGEDWRRWPDDMELLIRADRRAPFRYVALVLRAANHQDLGRPRVRFAVRHPDDG